MMLVMRPCAQHNIACRRHCAHFGHPRPYLSPATPLHSPPNIPPRSWTSTTPTHASFYLCTAPEQPALMLVVRPCAQRNHVCRVHSAHFGHPRPYLSPATPLHSPPHMPPRSMEQHCPHPCFVLLLHCPRAACNDACDACGLPSRSLRSRSPPSSLPSPDPTHAPRSPPSSLPNPIPTLAPPV